MTEEVNVGMGALAPKKSMSKGCLIAIIVAIALLLLVGAFVYIAIENKTDVVRYGTSMTLNTTKVMLVESNLEGVDTVVFNKAIDDFNILLYADTATLDILADSLRFIAISNVFSFTQTVVADKKIDSSEVTNLIEILVAKYPDLVTELIETEMYDSTQTDSTY